MARIITKAVKAAATRDYVTGNKTLKEVALTHEINPETLRIILGNKVRPRGTRYLPDGTIKIPATKNGRKIRKSSQNKITPNSNRRWTRAEDEMLREAVISKMTVEETGELLGRSYASIYCHKNQLINEGFISDPETRFVVPAGITRVRKPMEFLDPTSPPVDNIETIPVIEAIVESVKTHVSAPVNNNDIKLEQLAQIVKDFGVNITMSVTSEGTEVRMSK
jgi:transposase-like protein